MTRLHEYRRVIGFCEVLYFTGRKLKRQGIKYTTLAVILSAAALIGNSINSYLGRTVLPPQTKLITAMIPAAVALVTFGLGNLLVAISNLLSSEKILVADANSMNLMEDRKKADLKFHLQELWDRVFKYESRISNHKKDTHELERIQKNHEKLRRIITNCDTDFMKHFGIDESTLDEFVEYVACFRPLSNQMQECREGFITTAAFAIQEALPQKYQQHLSGCDLSLVEDWYDGAFFNPNDCKLQEQYSANKTIRGIRKVVGIPFSVKFREVLFGTPVPLWHGLTMKKIGTSVGIQLTQMNEKYVPDTIPNFFDAQDFLWNNPETDNLVIREFGGRGNEILADMKARRKKIFRDIFSHSMNGAHEQIFRMFGRDFIRALELRLAYDIEFAADLLDYKPDQDVVDMEELLSYPVYPSAKIKVKTQQAKAGLSEIDTFIAENIPSLDDRPLEKRAARIGYGINLHSIQALVKSDKSAAIAVINEKLAPAHQRFTRRICLLRQHYELTRIQLISYVKMVDELAEYDNS